MMLPFTYNNKKYEQIQFRHINKCAGRSVCKWMQDNDIPHLHRDGGCSHVDVKDYQENIFYFAVVRDPYDRLYSAYLMWSDFHRSPAEEVGNPAFKHKKQNPLIKTPPHAHKIPIQVGNNWLVEQFSKPTDENFNNFVKALYTAKDYTYAEFAKYFLKRNVLEGHSATPGTNTDYENHLLDEQHSPIKRLMFRPCTDWLKCVPDAKVFKFENLIEIENFFNTYWIQEAPLSSIRDTRHLGTTTKAGKSYIKHYNKQSIEIVNELFYSDFKTFGYEVHK